MKQNRPGTPDTAYGNQGIASIPPVPPANPDVKSLQVAGLADDGNGNLVFCDLGEGDGTERVFTRVLRNGQWDQGTGHVKIPYDPGLPDQSHEYGGLLYTVFDGEPCIFAAGIPAYYDEETFAVLNFISIARLDDAFRPVLSFGTRGVALPNPGEAWIPILGGFAGASRIPAARLARHADSTATPAEKVFAQPPSRRQPMCLVDQELRVIVQAILNNDEGEFHASWVAYIDPATGELIEASTSRRARGLLPLLDGSGRSIRTLRGHFFKDGALLLLALNADERVVLLRYNANGELDRNFADNGERNLFANTPGMSPGMDVNDDRIVITRAVDRQLIDPTVVFCFNHAGQNDQNFNGGQPLTLRHERGGLVLSNARLDDQGRIVLAGPHLTAVNVGTLNVCRLTYAGALDESFGVGGYFDSGPDLYHSNELYLDPDGIRVFTMRPLVGDRDLLEVILKLNA